MRFVTRLASRSAVVLLLLAGSAASLALAVSTQGQAGAPAGSLSEDLCPPIPKQITTAQAVPPLDFCGIDSQTSMDLYSWFTFIAMSWPADLATCGPDLSKSVLSGDGPVVWESYLQDSEVYVAPRLMPVAWCPQKNAAASRLALLPASVQTLARQVGKPVKVLDAVSKVTPGLDLPAIEQALGGTLTDQNGNFVRYEIVLNKDEYGYLTRNGLWSQKGQAAFRRTVSFPQSRYSNGNVYDPKGIMGAMEVKAAWKVLSDSEKSSGRFYAREAIVYDEGGQNAKVVTVGLVGLHIIHKTQAQPQWLWSTFEQEDNAPTLGDAHLAASYSFNNPKCSLADCPPNEQTYLGQTGTQPTPVQVWRTTPIEGSAKTLNPIFQGLLKGSVWQHYRLVGTQWRGEIITPQPLPLANAVLETYIQSYASCNGCHSGATLAVCSSANCATKPQSPGNADFSFLLGEAQ